jgi:hypothetical protein
MKLVGLMIVRNEAWCLPATLPVALDWLDALVVLVHASVDQTVPIVAQFAAKNPKRLVWGELADPDWNETTYRSRALNIGRAMGGTHFVIHDADELLSPSGHNAEEFRQRLGKCPPGHGLRLPWIQCWRSPELYRSDRSYTVPFAFADAPGLEYDQAGDGYQLHQRVPPAVSLNFAEGVGRVLHLQHVVWNRVCAKQALYQMTEVMRWKDRRPAGEIAAQYSASVDESELHVRAVPGEWWPQIDGRPAHERLDLRSEAWQAGEIRRLLDLHGRERFAGLNLLGF